MATLDLRYSPATTLVGLLRNRSPRASDPLPVAPEDGETWRRS